MVDVLDIDRDIFREASTSSSDALPSIHYKVSVNPDIYESLLTMKVALGHTFWRPVVQGMHVSFRHETNGALGEEW